VSPFPGTVGLLHRLDGGISLTFLTRFPTPGHARWLSESRLATWLSAAKYTRAATRTPQQLMAHLKQAPPGLADGAGADTGEMITVQLVALLQSLKERIKALESHVALALVAHADGAVFTSLPRSGTVRAAALLAEIGDAVVVSRPKRFWLLLPGCRPRPALPAGPARCCSTTAATVVCARPWSTSPMAAARAALGSGYL